MRSNHYKVFEKHSYLLINNIVQTLSIVTGYSWITVRLEGREGGRSAEIWKQRVSL